MDQNEFANRIEQLSEQTTQTQVVTDVPSFGVVTDVPSFGAFQNAKAQTETSAETKTETETETYKTYKVSKCANLNLRESPAKEGKIISVLKTETELTVDLSEDQSEYGWTHVYTNSGVDGYVMSMYLSEV